MKTETISYKQDKWAQYRPKSYYAEHYEVIPIQESNSMLYAITR